MNYNIWHSIVTRPLLPRTLEGWIWKDVINWAELCIIALNGLFTIWLCFVIETLKIANIVASLKSFGTWKWLTRPKL